MNFERFRNVFSGLWGLQGMTFCHVGGVRAHLKGVVGGLGVLGRAIYHYEARLLLL